MSSPFYCLAPSVNCRLHPRLSDVVGGGLCRILHEVIVANVREPRAISHSNRKSDTVDAEKIARFARIDPEILRPICHRTVAQQEALTLIRARNLIVRLRTAEVNFLRGLAKPCGYRLPASSTLCCAQRCMSVLLPRLAQALGPVLEATTRINRNKEQRQKHYEGKDKDGLTSVTCS
jgi:transposase